MTLLTWCLIGFYLFGIVGVAMSINEPRKPLGPGMSLAVAIVGSINIMLLMYWMMVD